MALTSGKTIKLAGSATAFSNEATTKLTANTVYQISDATKRVRFVRDKLTSTSGTPAFDYQLLRQFTQNRLSASIAIVLLVACVGALSSLWSGMVLAGVWTLAVFAIHGVVIA